MNVKEQAVQIISKVAKLPKNQIAELLETPPESKLGDLSFPCFVLSKELKKSPGEIAVYLREKITIPKDSIFKRIEIAGPYLNFFMDKCKYAAQIIKKVDKDFGKSTKHKGKQVLIEHTSTNPSGPTNIGRIRNSFIGDTLVRLHRAIGYNVRVHYYVNDLGKQVAIIAWGFKNKIAPDKYLIEKYKKYAKNPDYKVFFVYVPANKLVKEADPYMEQIDEMLAKSEEDNKVINQMHKVAKTCLEGQKKILARFGIFFDKFDFESSFVKNKSHLKFIEKLIKMPEHIILDGAHALDLSKYGLGRRGGGTVFQRSSGASVYLLKDLAYHEYKLGLADFNIIVLGEDHKVEAAELKKILELLGILNKNKKLDVVHLSFVNLAEGRLSTRRGETIPADLVLDEGVEKALKLIKNRNPKINKKEAEKLAEKIAAGAIKYFELKVAPMKSILFDWDLALDFEGNTGPYLQYALVRANKILQKAKAKSDFKNLELLTVGLLTEPQEFELTKKIALFPELVEKAAESYSPQLIANYAYELSQLFSTFYEKCPVIKAEKKLKGARLALVKAFAQTLKNALNLLGVEEVEMM